MSCVCIHWWVSHAAWACATSSKNESCHVLYKSQNSAHGWVMSHMNMSRPPYMSHATHAYIRTSLTSPHISPSHVTSSMNETCHVCRWHGPYKRAMSHVTYACVMSPIHEPHTYIYMHLCNEPWVSSYMHISRPLWMSHVTYLYVMSPINEPHVYIFVPL